MVAPDGQVKVLDFGLAKAAVESGLGGATEPTRTAARAEALTGEGAVVGTAPYMSPEQLQGKAVDARSDVFSLGIVIYEMVTGNRPFRGDSGIELASSILKDGPPSVADLRGDLPRHLGRIIEHCLEKKPDERFQSVKDVRNQLASLRRETQTDTLIAIEPDKPRRRSGLVVAAGAIGLALIALGAFFVWKNLPVDRQGAVTTVARAEGGQHKIVILPFENLGAPEDEYFADGMTEEITSRLAALEGLSVISRASAMRYKNPEIPLEQIGSDLGVDYVLDGTVRWQRSADGPARVRVTPQLIRVDEDTSLWTSSYDAVLADIFQVQSEIAVQVSEALGVALARLRAHLARVEADEQSGGLRNLSPRQRVPPSRLRALFHGRDPYRRRDVRGRRPPGPGVRARPRAVGRGAPRALQLAPRPRSRSRGSGEGGDHQGPRARAGTGGGPLRPRTALHRGGRGPRARPGRSSGPFWRSNRATPMPWR